ncbi:hypothetical protein MKS88_005240 [Plasmodium brasilianum]|uniref:Uncharacterized protein n=1 Tax=Plasmodium brasilianum TaxID=5824 RepID=A0ACB9Y089_PLABR|nr:hypothetical protein MKS88_005240 [Plasmodium brasilianum]
MMEKISNLSFLTKFVTFTLFFWVSHYSNESSPFGKLWNKKNNQSSNSLKIGASRLLKGQADVIDEQRNAYLREQLMGMLDNTEDDITFAKQFNVLMKENSGQNEFNKYANVDKSMDACNYDGEFSKIYNLYVNNNNSEKKSNPIYVKDDLAKKNNSLKQDNNTSKRNTQNSGNDFENLHNSFKFNMKSSGNRNKQKNESSLSKKSDSSTSLAKTANSPNINMHNKSDKEKYSLKEDSTSLANRANALKYAQNIQILLNKFKYFNNMETAVSELKKDSKTKKLIDELIQGNVMENFFYMLKYADDSKDILNDLNNNDNIEKLLYVLKFFDNGKTSNEKKMTFSDVQSKGKKVLKIKRSLITSFIINVFKKFDQMYENQLYSLFNNSDKTNLKDASDFKKAMHYIGYMKIFIPIIASFLLIGFFIAAQEVAKYVIIVLSILASTGYTLFKAKKCYYKNKVAKAKSNNK